MKRKTDWLLLVWPSSGPHKSPAPPPPLVLRCGPTPMSTSQVVHVWSSLAGLVQLSQMSNVPLSLCPVPLFRVNQCLSESCACAAAAAPPPLLLLGRPPSHPALYLDWPVFFRRFAHTSLFPLFQSRLAKPAHLVVLHELLIFLSS